MIKLEHFHMKLVYFRIKINFFLRPIADHLLSDPYQKKKKKSAIVSIYNFRYSMFALAINAVSKLKTLGKVTNQMHPNMKAHLYKTYVRPALTYGVRI
ncbi:hypothetical protein BpHYR1_008373 [Brachionus plicatilis]|uniref:Uncharacterized protein n=1 Tax=Brachionus plicatilis TaxID=10195 RepID=A0A3M7RRD5_BRAPC|nr:hypothetical protein BpHYR1_008373 [Brachionus plicatilis]